MKSALKYIIVSVFGAVVYLLVRSTFGGADFGPSSGAGMWGRLAGLFGSITKSEERRAEAEPPPPPPPTPAELAARAEDRIHALRMELTGELINFQQSYDFRTGGWGGPSNSGSRASYSTAEPETASFIAKTTNPKLKRARELQREIEQLKLEVAQRRRRSQ